MIVSFGVTVYILLVSRWFYLNWKNTVSWLELDSSVRHLRSNKFFLSYLILQNAVISLLTPIIALGNAHALNNFWGKKVKVKVSTTA